MSFITSDFLFIYSSVQAVQTLGLNLSLSSKFFQISKFSEILYSLPSSPCYYSCSCFRETSSYFAVPTGSSYWTAYPQQTSENRNMTKHSVSPKAKGFNIPQFNSLASSGQQVFLNGRPKVNQFTLMTSFIFSLPFNWSALSLFLPLTWRGKGKCLYMEGQR